MTNITEHKWSDDWIKFHSASDDDIFDRFMKACKKVNQEHPCMHDDHLPGTVTGVACNCPKCTVT